MGDLLFERDGGKAAEAVAHFAGSQYSASVTSSSPAKLGDELRFPHGFRSSFRDWVDEATAFADWLAEAVFSR